MAKVTSARARIGEWQSLNSSDDFLDELRRKQAERKESKLTKIKGFIRRNSRRFQVAGLFTVVFLVLAVRIGFTAAVNITSTRLLIEGHPCHGYLCKGTMNTTFSPILYPVNHLFGSEISTEITVLSEPYDSSGESAEERIIARTLFNELPINIPFFYVAGFILAVGLEKAFRKLTRKKSIRNTLSTD